MAQYHDSLMRDPEMRESLRVMQTQRSMRVAGVIGAIIVAIIVGFLGIYLMYSDEYESAKEPPGPSQMP